jgi:hypothetical protein
VKLRRTARQTNPLKNEVNSLDCYESRDNGSVRVMLEEKFAPTEANQQISGDLVAPEACTAPNGSKSSDFWRIF